MILNLQILRQMLIKNLRKYKKYVKNARYLKLIEASIEKTENVKNDMLRERIILEYHYHTVKK
jgi:hypothetical protein